MTTKQATQHAKHPPFNYALVGLARKVQGLSINEWAALNYICGEAPIGKDGQYIADCNWSDRYIPQKTMAKDLGASVSTVRRALQGLAEKGLIIVVRRGFKGKDNGEANNYIPNVNALIASAHGDTPVQIEQTPVHIEQTPCSNRTDPLFILNDKIQLPTTKTTTTEDDESVSNSGSSANASDPQPTVERRNDVVSVPLLDGNGEVSEIVNNVPQELADTHRELSSKFSAKAANEALVGTMKKSDVLYPVRYLTSEVERIYRKGAEDFGEYM